MGLLGLWAGALEFLVVPGKDLGRAGCWCAEWIGNYCFEPARCI